MTAVILPFPAYHVRIAREDPAWLVICRDHGWLHGSRADAAANAGWLANNHGVTIIDRSGDGPRNIRCPQKETQMPFDDTNRGVLLKNDRKDGESSPDYKGTINVDGVEHWLNGWIKESKKGDKFMSLSRRPKEEPKDKAKPAGKQFNDDLPWMP